MTEGTRPPVMFRNGGLAVQTPFSFVLSVLFYSKLFGSIFLNQRLYMKKEFWPCIRSGSDVVRDCRGQRLTVLTRAQS